MKAVFSAAQIHLVLPHALDSKWQISFHVR